MKRFLQIKKIPFIFFAISVFLLLNIFFNLKIFKEDIINYQPQKVTIDDGVVTEFLTETEYQNLTHLKNPFGSTDKILYPFKTNFSLNDTSAVNLPFLVLLRKFFSIHQATMIIALLNILFSNIMMYIFLRRLGIGYSSSFLASLVYGFSPFISQRIQGHLTYTPLYLFPLQFFLFHVFIYEKTGWKKSIFSVLLGLLLAFTYLANPYYFILTSFIIIFFLLYYLVENRKIFFNFVKQNAPFFLLAFLVFILVLIPLFFKVFKLIYFEGLEKRPNFIGSIILSADLASFFMPSEFNPIYANIMEKIFGFGSVFGKLSYFFFHSWDKFAYPGIIISILYIFLIFFRRKISIKLYDTIRPYFWISIAFAILMLGPFLKIFNRWFIVVDEGIKIYAPLPYLIFHYIPGAEVLRAPARFIAGFVFFASLVFAFLLNDFLLKIREKKRVIIIILIFLVFFADQMYVIRNRITTHIPLKIYEYIKKDPRVSTVLEIPFTVRDGLQYAGFVHATSIMKSPLLHDKPVIGGYLSRVNPAVFQYYQGLPFIGHVAKIIDKGNYHLYKEQPQEPKISAFSADIQTITDELDFLNIRYVVLKQNETYASVIQDILEKAEFNSVMQDGEYRLFRREQKKKEFTTVSFGSNADYLYIAQGFSLKENGFRWVEGKQAKVFVRSDEKKKNMLTFKAASFHIPQDVLIYVNETYAGQKFIDVEDNSYSLDISDMLQPGINTVFFKFSQTYKPSDVLPNNNDTRNLAIKFYSLKIE